ncbi:choice-of-anchor P family protein [Amycolatopsis sp. SID8362]|uniref:choice-of-anchor P family protein n=1 Tax=Amycolatopsis sp. SID8362 TaxID=2690346 RepID=UPI00136B465D|nr:choice-of-anchor P family protein [Amycolatopsis sp. SID8362]NBH07498.1 hypothetical protein [Amycolatopsis sp. SID8362]NED44194.1 hypothetical protein [Amycolatopsis sp. SID8362]
MRLSALRAAGVAGLAAAGLFAAAVPAQAAQVAGTGSAYGASTTITLASGVNVSSGQLAPTSTDSPGTNSVVGNSLVGDVALLLTVDTVTSTSEIDASNNVTESGGVTKLASQALPLTAEVLTAKCTAKAADVTTTNPGGLTGSSTITGLTFFGQAITPTGEVNQSQTIAGVGTIILNEQTTDPTDQSLTVNALHIKIDPNIDPTGATSGDIILGSATCGTYLAPAAPTTTPTTAPNPTTAPPTTPTTPGGDSGSGSGTGTVVPEGAPETGDGSEAAVTAP